MNNFVSVPKKLQALGYDVESTESANALLNASTPTTLDYRSILENFFRQTALHANRLKGIPFSGNLQRFHETREFAKNLKWITDREAEFIRSFYGLISDSDKHGGPSHMDPHLARNVVLYSMELISTRIETPPKNPAPPSTWPRHTVGLANRFITELRRGLQPNHQFRGVDFDRNTMEAARQLLKDDDIPLLFTVLRDTSAEPDLRNVCTGLIRFPNESPKERARKNAMLHNYYLDNLSRLPWQVERGLALALANRENFGAPILRFVKIIEGDRQLLEINLAQTDRYYSDPSEAKSYYFSRLQRAEVLASGCVWEAFYLSYRFGAWEKDALFSVLHGKSRTIENEELGSWWRQRIEFVKCRPSGTGHDCNE
jgi:hypothetical protein